MPSDEDLDGLVAWLATFPEVKVSSASPLQLCDGVAMLRAMVHMYVCNLYG